MRILFLTQIIPYPPDAGPKIKTWHVLRHLTEKGHQIILASFVRPEEQKYVEFLKEVCAQVHTVPIRRSKLGDIYYWLCSHLTNRPFLIERDNLPEMRALVSSLLATETIDAIHADQLTMAQFAVNMKNAAQHANSAIVAKPMVVFDAHNAVWTIVQRMRQSSPWYLKPILSLEARRIKTYEGRIILNCDVIFSVTDLDRQFLIQAARSVEKLPGRKPASLDRKHLSIIVVPIAVDTNLLKSAQRQIGSRKILTMGTLHYPPNADGIRWFIQEVYPLVLAKVPDASLTIVGKNPPHDFLQLAAIQPERIKVTGYIPDLHPYIKESALMVVPVRAGSGMRVRILEAFAQNIPVVTTTIGLEGIAAKPGVDVLVGDSPEEFATAVVRLIQDTNLQGQIARCGRALAETRYDWRIALSKIDEVYEDGSTNSRHE